MGLVKCWYEFFFLNDLTVFTESTCVTKRPESAPRFKLISVLL